MSDPSRLMHGDDEGERVLLESLRADAPADELRAGMWTAIAAQTAGLGIAGSASAATGAAPAKVGLAKLTTVIASKALAAKVAVVIAVGAVGAGAALMQPSQQAAPVQVAPRKVEAAAVVTETPRFPHELETCQEDGTLAGCAETAAPAPVQAPAPKRAKRRPVATAEAQPVAQPAPLDTLQAESRMIAAVRAQLRSGDLAGAEQTLNQARDRFAQGALGQERELLQIELLAKLGDADGADHRARRFLRKHPDSPHAKSVQRFLIAP